MTDLDRPICMYVHIQPRNLLLAMIGEVGEIAAIMETLHPNRNRWTVAEKDEVSRRG